MFELNISVVILLKHCGPKQQQNIWFYDCSSIPVGKKMNEKDECVDDMLVSYPPCGV